MRWGRRQRSVTNLVCRGGDGKGEAVGEVDVGHRAGAAAHPVAASSTAIAAHGCRIQRRRRRFPASSATDVARAGAASRAAATAHVGAASRADDAPALVPHPVPPSPHPTPCGYRTTAPSPRRLRVQQRRSDRERKGSARIHRRRGASEVRAEIGERRASRERDPEGQGFDGLRPAGEQWILFCASHI